MNSFEVSKCDLIQLIPIYVTTQFGHVVVEGQPSVLFSSTVKDWVFLEKYILTLNYGFTEEI